MLIDLRKIPDNSVIRSDVCIVGAGAAGIALALELRDQPFHVCLVESGGLRTDNATQALMRGESAGHPYFRLDEVRQSGFGGTTSVWAGACRPLERLDFEQRAWVSHSGWPISRRELDPYYARAQVICQLGPYAYEVDDWDPSGEQRLPLPSDRMVTHIFQVSPPTRFGRVYRQAIVSAPNITTYLYANAVEIETNRSADVATSVHLATVSGKSARVEARLFILAAGGIENPRLLLLSNRVMPAGLGNRHDLVGRFFMDHLYMNSGELLLRDAAPFYSVHYDNRMFKPTSIEAVLVVAEEVLKREGLVRSAVHFPPRWRTLHSFNSEGARALAHLVREVRLGNVPYDLAPRLGRVLADFEQIAFLAYRRLMDARRSRTRFAARTLSEQAPNPDSRVVLSSERDSLGRSRVRLVWRLSNVDLRSIRRAHELLAEVVHSAGVGEFRVELDTGDAFWPSRVTGGRHHMGTTRMASAPDQGVVDADGRVHDMANLFIVGSSVFPTAGYANPTLTIVAMALRLADHVKALLS